MCFLLYMKTIKLFGKNIVLRGEVEDSPIILTDEAKDKRKIKEIKVFLVGDEVKKVKVGDDVRVDSSYLLVAHQGKQINPFASNEVKYKKDNEFYILCDENDIVGKF